jgi:subtilisin family serine protease
LTLAGVRLDPTVRRPARRLLCLATALLATTMLPAPAHGQQAVLDPVLRRLQEPQVQQNIFGFGALRQDAPPAELPFGGLLALDTDPTGRPRVGLLLELPSPGAVDALAALRALGAEIGSVIGAIATARVPIDALAALEELPFARIHAARTLRPQHDSSMNAIGVPAVRQHHAGVWTGTTGAGVIIGLVDTGIDLLHPDFHDTSGATRVLGVWDQTLGGVPPQHFSYGNYCGQAAIQQVVDTRIGAACPITDGLGHGTHVAGTAAGDGSAGDAPPRYAGVAPNADLLVVKAGNASISEDRVADALLWLRDQGRALGRPVVVNLSFGHQYGPHDGSSLLEQVVDELAAPGFLIVIAGGNSGANENTGSAAPPRYIHARLQPQPLRTDTLTFRIASYAGSINGCNNFAWISLWYEHSDSLELTVMRPNETQVTARQAEIVTDADEAGRVVISNAFGIQRPHVSEAFIELDGCGASGSPMPGMWSILVRPATASTSGAPADLYIHTVSLGAAGSAWGERGFDNSYVIGSPGTARRAITVGAFATRQCWPTREGENCFTQQEQTGDLARFSSGGPTRDGRLKPEITAPGLAVVSALSRNANAPQERVAPGAAHWALEGTSMAAPHVAGAIALLLEHRPSLSPEDVFEILRESARSDLFTGRTYGTPGLAPSAWWGHGKLDVPAMLARVLTGGLIARLTIDPAVDTVPRNGYAQLTAEMIDAAGQAVYASVTWTSLEPATAVVDPQGRVFGLQLGSARIVATSDIRADTAAVTVAEPAVLIVSGAPAASAGAGNVTEGGYLPLLALRLSAQGPEQVNVRSMAFEVAGADPNARLILFSDANGNGRVDDNDHVIHRTTRVNLGAAPRIVDLRLDTLVVDRNDTRHLLLAAEVSAVPQHGASFSAQLLPDRLQTITLNSRTEDNIRMADPVIAAATRATVLHEGEAFALSENPVRADAVTFNFATVPSVAAVYTVAGARVADLRRRFDGLAFTWDLTNDSGRRIVPGVYLLVFRIGGDVVRQRLLILGPAAGTGDS